MSVRQFRINEADLDSDCREMQVEGELDLAVADQLRERLETAARAGRKVCLCLERCDFIDSTGIAIIVAAHKLMAKTGGRLFLCNPSGQVSRILRISGLSDVGLVSPSVEALGELRGGQPGFRSVAGGKLD